MLDSAPELVRQTKRSASFFSNPQYTQHVDYASKNGQRKVKEETRWQIKKALGKGGFGAVYLEECIQGDRKGGLRAVKEIKKPGDTNYYRELEAIALFSFKQVSTTAPSYLSTASYLIYMSRSIATALSSHLAGTKTPTAYLSPWNTFLVVISKNSSTRRYQRTRGVRL
jgi:hypothetical protein